MAPVPLLSVLHQSAEPQASRRTQCTKHGANEKAQSKNAGKVTYYWKGLLTGGLEEPESGDFMTRKVKFLVVLSL